MKNIDHNSMPMAIGSLHDKIDKLSCLIKNLVPETQSNDKMDTEELIKFLHSQGIRLSKSKIYKLTATGDIPCMRFGRQLVFPAKEIGEWIANSMIDPQDHFNESVKVLSRAARKGERRMK